MKNLHIALTGLSLTIVLLSINRLTDLTLAPMQPYGFLRRLDLNAMLTIPILGVIFYYIAKKDVENNGKPSVSKWLLPANVLFIIGIYLYGSGSGNHEITNYLNGVLCDYGTIESAPCDIVGYNDDVFSHIVYFLGLILLNVTLIGIENIKPREKPVSRKDLMLISVNALFIALGIFANLAFEQTIIDIISFSLVMLLTLYLLFRRSATYTRLPITFYFAVAYTVGIVATILYKLLTA